MKSVAIGFILVVLVASTLDNVQSRLMLLHDNRQVNYQSGYRGQQTGM